MTKKKLVYALSTTVAIIVLMGGMFFILKEESWLPIMTKFNTDNVIKSITVSQLGGSSLLIAECGDRNYIRNKADYIIEGTINDVWSSWAEMKTGIYTYANLAIGKYIKGTPFTKNKENELTVITPGGCVVDKCQAVEDQPMFHKGERVRIYFKKAKGEFSIVCGQKGVEEI